MTIRIEHGDMREVLARMEPESVHCVVTSIPFYGLRDYKGPEEVWPSAVGGQPSACEHDWGEWSEWHDEREPTKHGKTRTTDRHYGDDSRRFDGNHQKHIAGQFCRRCGAWRGQLGLEPDPELYVAHIIECFRAVKRVLRKDGVLWFNVGDSYAGSWSGNSMRPEGGSQRPGKPGFQPLDERYVARSGVCGFGTKPKDLMLMPFEVAKALRDDGWWLRSCLPWVKPNPMPDSAKDRPGASIEWWFLLTKSARYFYDHAAVCRQAVAVNEHDFTGQRYEAPGQLPQSGSRKSKKPDNWDTRPGAHGRVHRQGREKGASAEIAYGRNFRNSDLFYDSLGILLSGADGEPLALDCATEPYPDAHFATFPTKLIEPLIKAGTSEKGCCPECGAPWVREISAAKGGDIGQFWHDHSADAVGGNVKARGGAAWKTYQSAETTGWRPSCKCRGLVDGDPGWGECPKERTPQPVPCVVLDPFSGSGTVGLVADRLGRDAILIDNHAAYCEMARQRIADDAGMFFSLKAAD